MRMIRRWMVQVGAWLIRLGTEQPGIPTLPELAKILTERQDRNWPDRDGECKRAAVYAQLVNTFPDVKKREISRVIEESL